MHRSVGVDDPRQDLGTAEVDTDHTNARACRAGNLTRRMAREEKPYRVYRGGRAKGKVPTVRPARVRSPEDGTARGRATIAVPAPRRREARALGPRIGAGSALLVLLLIVWAVAGWFSFTSGVSDANKRLDAEREVGARHRRAAC